VEEANPTGARSALSEVLLVYVVVAVATFAITRLRWVAYLKDYVHLGVGALFLLVALRMTGRDRPALDRFGIALGGLLAPAEDSEDRPAGPLGIYDLGRLARRSLPSALRETGVALALAAVIFPPFFFGFAWWHGAQGWPRWSLPHDFASFAFAQLLVVALPEEVFFRGYVQTRLDDHFGRPSSKLFLKLGVHPASLVLQALLFALVHFVAIHNPARLAVFFPGLLFGVVRAWRGGVGAAIVLHALSNVYSDLLVRGWLR
tara:strand:+ start:334 stop:1113 length:780 start_codon:yes stop_codon:yes gene_type:complete